MLLTVLNCPKYKETALSSSNFNKKISFQISINSPRLTYFLFKVINGRGEPVISPLGRPITLANGTKTIIGDIVVASNVTRKRRINLERSPPPLPPSGFV